MRQCSPPPVSHVSSVRCHVSGVKCQTSSVRRHVSLKKETIYVVFFGSKKDEVVELVSRGSFIKGATPV